MKTVILCGGRGTRAYPLTAEVPKPLLPVGSAGVPVLRHLLDVYAGQGRCDFVLAGGWRWQALAEYAATLPTDWTVEVVDTGEETGTGERLRRCLDRIDGTFLATYGDGLGDVDLDALLATHRAHGRRATVTAVPLRSQYGTLDLAEDGRVTGFREKPVLAGHWVNAGFFALEPSALRDLPGDDLERDVLPALAAAGELHVHRHVGFWRSMDTHKDALELGALADDGAPWLTPPRS